MINVNRLMVLVATLVIVFLFAIIGTVGSEDNSLPVLPESTIEPTPVPSLGNLPEPILPKAELEGALHVAGQYFGLSAEVAESIDIRPGNGFFTTYEEWMVNQEVKMGEMFYKDGTIQRPVYVTIRLIEPSSLTVRGDLTKYHNHIISKDDNEFADNRNLTFEGLVVVIFADDGMPAFSSAYPSDTPFPDFWSIAKYEYPYVVED